MTRLRDESGPFFGEYGGRFMPEPLIEAIDEITAAYEELKADPAFHAELAALQRTYTGRPSIITEVPRFAAQAGGARVILKREDLNHTGSHKINNVLGPGAAHPQARQDADHRRDRRRPARRRDGDRGGALRPRMRRVHG